MRMQIKRHTGLAMLAAGIGGLLAGCSANKENVLAVTGTVIGVQIHQKDADKTPELKVGYARTEFAFVPTDKRADTNSASGSAGDSAEVLMEINAQGNVGLGTAYQGGIYQRLAVGKTAVQQPGAAFMLAKDQSGNISTNTARSVSESFKATYKSSSKADSITQWLEADSANRGTLANWMAANHIPGHATFWLNQGDEPNYAKAIADLRIPCPENQ